MSREGGFRGNEPTLRKCNGFCGAIQVARSEIRHDASRTCCLFLCLSLGVHSRCSPPAPVPVFFPVIYRGGLCCVGSAHAGRATT
jgi:hypothetical protein